MKGKYVVVVNLFLTDQSLYDDLMFYSYNYDLVYWSGPEKWVEFDAKSSLKNGRELEGKRAGKCVVKNKKKRQ